MTRKEAIHYRGVIEQVIQAADDATALTVPTLHPAWVADTPYTMGFRVGRSGKLYRCLQAHTSMTGWEPENVPALWEQVNEHHEGSREDPIPYEGNMALAEGLYYIQAGIVYLCIRDTVNPVYGALAELDGIYVEAAS